MAIARAIALAFMLASPARADYWVPVTQVDAFTDEVTELIATDAERNTLLGKDPVIALWCKPGKMARLSFVVGAFIGGDITTLGGGRTVKWVARIDNNKAFMPVSAYTHHSSPYLAQVATGLVNHKRLGALISQMRSGETIAIRVWDFNEEAHDIEFSLKEFDNAVEGLSQKCKMPKGWNR